MMLFCTKRLLKDTYIYNRRRISKYLNQDKTAKAIRKTFLDFFVMNNHSFVRSSPVVPYCDPSVAFVNSGMNQFKGIFTGSQQPQYEKVVNSQKCVRVGGKHNDLNIIGTDGYHHTFFEMLGNWSFGEYFKEDACELAWDLLTKVYKIPAERLYVTYFKGDSKLNLNEDSETKKIWKSLGIAEDRILPFGAKDNFWEMGPTGPCGVCTEIHYDHLGSNNRAQFVNKDLFDLIEIWNLVFIEYNRNTDGSFTVLPQKHVDTGMGFERITSVLQGKISNYDTDNFDYLFKATKKICSNVPSYKGRFGEKDWDNIDTSYRLLADHTRMITACLADGIIPEQNQKLRRIIRKSFSLGTNVFKKEKGLVKDLASYVVEQLGPFYTEMEKNIAQIHQILDYEEDVYKALRASAVIEWEKLTRQNPNLLPLDILECPSLIPAYKDLMQTNPKQISGDLAFRLYDTFGLDKDMILSLSKVLQLRFDEKGFKRELENAKQRSKSQSCHENGQLVNVLTDQTITTDDSFKYNYKKWNNDYVFKEVDVRILKIIQDNKIVSEIGPEVYCSLLLDKTNLYHEAGGQIGDKGQIVFKVTPNHRATFEVTDIRKLNNSILHNGFLKCDSNLTLTTDATGILYVNDKLRLDCMRNHTATHLLNAGLRRLKGAVCQKSSKVTDQFLNFDAGIFGPKLSIAEIGKLEERINDVISKKLDVKIRSVDSQELLSLDDLIMVPGEIYPENNIRLIEIRDEDGIVSREPCCGTHVVNTGDIRRFKIIAMKSLGRSTTSLYAVTNERADLAEKNASQLLEEIATLKKNLSDNIDKPEVLNMAVSVLRQKLKYDMNDPTILPVTVKYKCFEDLNDMTKMIKDVARGALNEFIEMEMQNVLESKVDVTKNNQKFLVHYLRTSMILETVPLKQATKLCPNIPVIVISYTDNVVKARCCVPKELCTQEFNAHKWLLETIGSTFRTDVISASGQDKTNVCHLKPKRIDIKDWDVLLTNGIETAKKYVEEKLE